MKTNDDDLYKNLLILILLFPLTIYHGFIISQLWGWFVVPLGVTAIGTWHGAGLTLIANFFKNINYTQNKADAAKAFTNSILAVSLWWGVGAIVHSIMT